MDKKFTCDYRMNESYFKETIVGQSDGHQLRLVLLGCASIAFAIFGYIHGHGLSSTILWALIGIFLIVGVLFSDAKRKGSIELDKYKQENINVNYPISIQIENTITYSENGKKNEYRFRDITGVRDTDRFIIIYFGEKRDVRIPILKSALVGGSVKDLKEWIQRQISVKA